MGKYRHKAVKRACLAIVLMALPNYSHAGDERWSMIPTCEFAVRITRPPCDGYQLLHAEEDFDSGIASLEFASRDDHGTYVHHSAWCRFWHRFFSAMSINGDAEGQIIVN
ncbi:hypothetical protein [Mesorhizobium sp. WSM3224]|uniref:hypothetical protein n=1 Tax=Mesorhizobium sp. WSM3224 TaxID=1040986 RepID=UPI0004825D94|nr:hypothetical protein [Mesorhizobium sp. WSM3224]